MTIGNELKEWERKTGEYRRQRYERYNRKNTKLTELFFNVKKREE
jgi:hypothetical protein